MHTYFIGYDAREHEAAGVAAFSLMSRCTHRSRVFMLEHRLLRKLKLFRRAWAMEQSGQMFDVLDGKPFSTEFSHSRFLVFKLAEMLGLTGPCMFVDCDWLFLEDPAQVMLQQTENPGKVGVVMRDRKVDEGSTKMDGMVQQNYSRKLWSAMFTFMPNTDLYSRFSVNEVNTRTGRDLHGFLGMADEEFWHIPETWHYIPSLDEKIAKPQGIHFSEFSPWLNPDKYSEHFSEFEAWHTEHKRYLLHAGTVGRLNVWHDLQNALVDAMA